MFFAVCSCIDADWLKFCFENDNLPSAVAEQTKWGGTKIDWTFAIKTGRVQLQIMRNFKIL